MQLKAYSQAYGKQSMQFKLLNFLREMAVYDPKAEKVKFSNCNLGSMRSTAKKWLLKSAIKLGLYLGEIEGDVGEIDVLTRWGCYEEALALIDETKATALEQCEFGWLARLYEQEIAVVRAYYEGEERIVEMSYLAGMVIECNKMQSIAIDIRYNSVLYIETNKYQFALKGEFDLLSAHTYFSSAFHNQKIERWPIPFQIDKLHLDEANYIFLDRYEDAVAVASQILELYNGNPDLRATRKKEHAKILFRMSANKTKLGSIEQGKKVLEEFRKVDPLAAENREFYLVFFLHTLFEVGYDNRDLSFAAEGATIWDDHKDYLLSLPSDSSSIITMLFVCSYHVAIGDMLEARGVINALYSVSDTIKGVWAMAIYRILHIIILLEEGDDTGLESYGKSYKRHLKAHIPAAEFGIAVLGTLCKTKHLEDENSLPSTLPILLELLQQEQGREQTTYKPFIYPLIEWVNRRIRLLQ